MADKHYIGVRIKNGSPLDDHLIDRARDYIIRHAEMLRTVIQHDSAQSFDRVTLARYLGLHRNRLAMLMQTLNITLDFDSDAKSSRGMTEMS